MAASHAALGQVPATQPARIIGMYVHQHWPYKHPYAARTWSLEDWGGYLDGLKQLGFNTVVIWPVLDTVPNPPTPSDRENIEKIARVIEMTHRMRMRAYLTISANVVADNAAAGQATFQERHFFHSDMRVNPADAEAVAGMMRFREQLMKPLAAMDGILIIDSDPGGYPGSTNAEFISLLVEHRRLLDRLRQGIELVYWMWAGWPAYARYYSTGKFAWGRPDEFDDALRMLKQASPEPYGLACGLDAAERAGLSARVLGLAYGAIEGEPVWPRTNYGGDAAWKAGRLDSPRGLVGNAQTHCVQLPSTFAFIQGALGKPLPQEQDYVAFADKLIPGRGRVIVDGWKALSGKDAVPMRACASRLQELSLATLNPGPLKGLLFGDSRRFVTDLVVQLQYQAAFEELIAAAEGKQDTSGLLAGYLKALRAWHDRHGYDNTWVWQAEPLKKLGLREIDEVLDPPLQADTPLGRVKEGYYLGETFTPRMIRAIERVLEKRGR